MGVTPCRCIAAGDVDRQHALACGDTWVQFDLKLGQGSPLCLGKIKNLLDGEIDVGLDLFWHLTRIGFDLCLGDDHFTRPLVQFVGVLAYCSFTILLDLGQHGVDDFLGRGRFGFGCLVRFFQIRDGHVVLLVRVFCKNQGKGLSQRFIRSTRQFKIEMNWDAVLDEWRPSGFIYRVELAMSRSLASA